VVSLERRELLLNLQKVVLQGHHILLILFVLLDVIVELPRQFLVVVGQVVKLLLLCAVLVQDLSAESFQIGQAYGEPWFDAEEHLQSLYELFEPFVLLITVLFS
jgi:hypothetical protein